MQTQETLLIGTTPFAEQSIRQTLSSASKLKSFQHLPATLDDACAVVVYHEPPLLNGLEALQEIRQKSPRTPVVMIGNGASQHDIVEAFQLGASDFLFFPLQAETLDHCLRRFQLREQPRKQGAGIFSLLKKWLSPSPLTVPAHSSGIVAPAMTYSFPVETFPPLRRPDVQVQLLGKFSVLLDGKHLDNISGRKTRALLAYLLLNYPKPVHREALLDKFWGGSTTDSARNCLNVTLHAIRKCAEQVAPGKPFILFKDDSYQFSPDLLVERDVDLFDNYWKKGRQIEQNQGMEAAVDTYHQAFAFYRGELLEDLLYEDWLSYERDRLKENMLVILDRLSGHFFEKGKFQVSLNLCQRMLEKDNCLEEAHCRAMKCYHEIGLRDKAIRQFQKCRDILKEELGCAPGKVTAELFEVVMRG